ncbi:MAG: HEAT repeat domain-containing protein [Devosia sp.]|nr:HEAT repeat domain-containing protein [Devosia sp.]
MSALSLSRDEFADALRKGKGRAVQHIRAHGDSGVEDLLLEACVRCQNYDPQCEGYRGDWLMGMLAMLPNAPRYHDVILRAFPDSTKAHDVEQMARMLEGLAEQGREEARGALYSKFDRQEFREDWTLSLRLISLDGIEGLLHVARVLGRRLASDADFWMSGYLQHVVDEQFGAEAVDAALRSAAIGDPDVRRFHDDLREAATEPVRGVPYSLDSYLADLALGGRKTRLVAQRFARYGSDSDHHALFELIEREADASRLASMLRVFSGRVDPPGGADRVLRFARHADPAVRAVAIDVLRRFRDERVADLSQDLLAAGSLEGMKLLAENSRPGDFKRAHALLPTVTDDEQAHDLALSIISIGQPLPDPEAADCLVWVYEQNPCSFCRQSAVDDLIKLDRLPEALATEGLDDCMSEIREAVAAAR